MTGDHIRKSIQSMGQSISKWDLFAAAALMGVSSRTPFGVVSEVASIADGLVEESERRRVKSDARP